MATKITRRKTSRFRGIAAEERQAQRRSMLIDAGLEVFGTVGFHAATVRAICTHANLTERYFYESFENREALFAAVYEHLVSHLRDALVAALLPAPRDVGTMARAGLTTLFGAMRDDPRYMRILFVDVFTVSDEVDRLSRRATGGFAQLVQTLVETMYPQDRRAGLDPRLVAHGLVGAAMNTVMYWAYGGYKEPLETVVHNCAVLFEALGAYFPQAAPTKTKSRSGKA
ncbi:TetR/AcrR family transcriptional regulator [Sinimarinibacterium sp. CAU 1509]|uniref:TetR/AcrR family transcriptional regulator n=1 Tax=Sinimarinibacterium sp. CAU 1509 TaxID=2562283 RepID=UPI0010AC93EE|nr:TetR/AcrR family transcriptional regulator [Sinimarinibacterium sp. CAU 1509]TJY62284.1 TetR/AcrR family transcriptional regulator [Sinimarinibacterium sp. CAU 1509]